MSTLDTFHFSYVYPASYEEQKAKNSLYVKTILFYHQEIRAPLACNELCIVCTLPKIIEQCKWHIVNKPVKGANLFSYTDIYFGTVFFLFFVFLAKNDVANKVEVQICLLAYKSLQNVLQKKKRLLYWDRLFLVISLMKLCFIILRKVTF